LVGENVWGLKHRRGRGSPLSYTSGAQGD
jgi:hypothetical protein